MTIQFFNTISGSGPNILVPDGFFEFTFTKASKYEYYDMLHHWMQDTVVALERGALDDRYRELVDTSLR
ncbi:MAG: hypothetical protein QXX64_00835 [Nitrososphaera sp.]